MSNGWGCRLSAIILALAIALFSLLGTSGTYARVPVSRPAPRGIYAVIPVDNRITDAKTNTSCSTPDLDTYLLGYYKNLLNNGAVSGLALQVHWKSFYCDPNDAAGGYDWRILDDAFATVADYYPGKTIQLIVSPGFFTPQWVFNDIDTAPECSSFALKCSCDPLFTGGPTSVSSKCGYATFVDSEGKKNPISLPLPLPWNSIYKSDWQTFLSDLQSRIKTYSSHSAFVSIAVAGPTSASVEMILPNGSKNQHDPTALSQWHDLLINKYSNSSYHNSDAAFIEEWKIAIDFFGSIFNGVTLVATTGSGLPNFTAHEGFPPPSPPKVPSGFAADCGRVAMDCAAETSVLAHFVKSGVGGANFKATQTSGINVAHATDSNLGLNGVKWLAETTSSTAQILGGGEFDTSFSEKPNEMGLNKDDQTTDEKKGITISPEQALYNLLHVYFDGTFYGTYYGSSLTLGMSPSVAPSNFKLTGVAPMNYLQIYDTDILYASANAGGKGVKITIGSGKKKKTIGYYTAQQLLATASGQLLQISEPPPPPPPPPPPHCPGGPHTCF